MRPNHVECCNSFLSLGLFRINYPPVSRYINAPEMSVFASQRMIIKQGMKWIDKKNSQSFTKGLLYF